MPSARSMDPLALMAWEAQLIGDVAELAARNGSPEMRWELLGGVLASLKEAFEIVSSALNKEAALPIDRGPLAVLRSDIDELEAAVRLRNLNWESGSERLGLLADKMLSVFIDEASERLRRQVAPLPVLEPPQAVLELDALLVRMGAKGSFLAGLGCLACWAFGTLCRGVELEWWNEWEWEEAKRKSEG